MILFEELRFLLVLLIVCGVGPAALWCLLGCLGLPREAEDFRKRGSSPHPALRATFPPGGRLTGDGLPRRFAPRNDERKERADSASQHIGPCGRGGAA